MYRAEQAYLSFRIVFFSFGSSFLRSMECERRLEWQPRSLSEASFKKMIETRGSQTFKSVVPNKNLVDPSWTTTLHTAVHLAVVMQQSTT